MPERIVINTGPIISIVAAMDNLDVLDKLYKEVYVTYEVCNEIMNSLTNLFAQN